MRSAAVVAVAIACLASQARADGVDAEKVAMRWLDAARAGSTKQLAALSASSLIVTDVMAGLSMRCVARLDIGSRVELGRAVPRLKQSFADAASWKATNDANDARLCPRPTSRRRHDVLRAKAGDRDLMFDGGPGVTFLIRVSKAGKVVFAGRSIYEGDH
jgi:hypothetical protein